MFQLQIAVAYKTGMLLHQFATLLARDVGGVEVRIQRHRQIFYAKCQL